MENNKLTNEQNTLVEKIFSLMEEAKKQGVGFVFDKTTYRMSALNATFISNIEIEEVSNNSNLNDSNMRKCQVDFHAHYYSDGDFLVAE